MRRDADKCSSKLTSDSRGPSSILGLTKFVRQVERYAFTKKAKRCFSHATEHNHARKLCENSVALERGEAVRCSKHVGCQWNFGCFA